MSNSPESQSAQEAASMFAPETPPDGPAPENSQPPAADAPTTKTPVTDAPEVPAADAPEAPATDAPATEAAHIVPPLDGLISAIRAGIASGASPEQRTAGATACRSILIVLEAKPGQPLTPAPPPTSPASVTSPIAALLKQPGILAKLASMSREQLIDLVKQTVAAMSKSPQAEQPTGPRFHLIQIPQPQRSGGQ